MSWDLAQIQGALQTNLETIPGLHCYDYLPDSPVTPAAIVNDPEEIVYDMSFQRGSDEMTLPILLVVQGTDRSKSEELSSFIASSGSNSIRAAIRSDPTLGGLVADCHVTRVDSFGRYTFGSVVYPGCKAHVSIYTGRA